jgi:hypothetical protein
MPSSSRPPRVKTFQAAGARVCASMASTTAWAPNSWLSSVISSGRRTAAVLTGDLVGAGVEDAARVGDGANAAADGERDEDLAGGAGDDVGHGVALVAGGGDVEEDEFVGACSL